ncbi:unnamed protein product [Thlaspi arvense]|uniref:Response regulatory domain-containing protein n=1 Tax=Thlaspi arvense TaxID=13288 RepID=A0AAU9S6R3_THLAR|nr:unnamed protein product [Thlaspi arvense]
MDVKRAQGIGETKQEEEEQEQHFHVLAVDDSLIDRKLLERLLTVSSYQVTCVDSGNKALEFLGLVDSSTSNSTASVSSPPCSCPPSSSQSSQQEVQGSKVNLIITDYSMPGMSGYDLLRRVKGSSWKDIPVVVMSSENVPARINMCLEGGAEEFLLKPVQLSDLKKLQSHLLKPDLKLTHQCRQEDEEDGLHINHETPDCNNTANKRKAETPDCCDDRSRLKIKELTVV